MINWGSLSKSLKEAANASDKQREELRTILESSMNTSELKTMMQFQKLMLEVKERNPELVCKINLELKTKINETTTYEEFVNLLG